MLGDAGKADPMCHAGKTDKTPLGKDKGHDEMLGDAGKADPMCHAGKTDKTPLGKDKGHDEMLGDAGKADPMCHAGKTDTTPLGKDKGQGGPRHSRCHVQTVWAMSSAPNKTRPAGERRWWQSNDDNYGTDVAFGEDWAPGKHQWFAIWYTPLAIQSWYFTPPDKWVFMGYALWDENTGDWESYALFGKAGYELRRKYHDKVDKVCRQAQLMVQNAWNLVSLERLSKDGEIGKDDDKDNEVGKDDDPAGKDDDPASSSCPAAQ